MAFIIALILFIKGLAIKKWPSTQAVVLNVAIGEYVNGDNEEHSNWGELISLQYDVGEKEYTIQRPYKKGLGFFGRVQKDYITPSGIKESDVITIFYNPKNPTDITFKKVRIEWLPFVYLIISALLLYLSLISV